MAELQRFARSEVRRSWLHVSAALRTHRLEPTQGPRYPGRDRPTPAWLPTPGLPHPGTTFEDTNSSPSHRVGRGPTPGATGGSPPNIKPWAVGGGQAPAPNGLHLSGTHWHCCAMTQNPTSAPQGCIFCAIVARQAEASVVFEDETVVVFMDRYPVTPGHLLVVPRQHAVGLEDLDRATSAHVWSVGHDMSRALRRSPMRSEGINVFLCDGEAAFQTVFHFHLHVIPRYAGDGWIIIPESAERERSLLDSEAQAIKDAIASTD